MDAIAGADLAHARRHLRVAQRRDVRVQMVFNLMAQVSGHLVEPAPAFEIAGALDLPEVPAATGFALNFGLGEDLRVGGEMPAEDDRVGPQAADQIGPALPSSTRGMFQKAISGNST